MVMWSMLLFAVCRKDIPKSLYYYFWPSGATSPTSVSDPGVPSTVPKLLPVLKRSLSCQGTSEPMETPAVPKLLPVKRSNSSQGLPDPVVSPVASSPPPVKVKQEKPESPIEYSPCQESLKKV